LEIGSASAEKGGIGGSGWVHPKGADSMAEWATAVLLCTNGSRKQSSRPA